MLIFLWVIFRHLLKAYTFLFTSMNKIIVLLLRSDTYKFIYARKFFRILHKMTELHINCDHNCNVATELSTKIEILFFALRYELALKPSKFTKCKHCFTSHTTHMGKKHIG